jgi:sarcosine oxidase, subunit gamma
MVNLSQLKVSPLKGQSFGNLETVSIREIAFIESCDLRVEPNSSVAKKVEKHLALNLPQLVGASAKGKVTALTLGPDWWLLIDANALLVEEIRESTSGEFISLVDVSAQRTCLEVSGDFAKAVLQHAWEQDLDDVAFKINACSQGLMARCPTIIHRTDVKSYRLYVRSSFAEHLYKFLIDAATEYVK